MYWTKITTDDDFEILNFPTKSEKLSVVIDSNPDAATVTLGYRGNDQLFHAYADGLMTATDVSAVTGEGVRLMARVTGTGAGTLIIGVASRGA